MQQLMDKFRKITTFIFDVDGVLTNSQLLITENGELLRSMNTRDGFALKTAIDKGFRVAIITGGGSQGVVKRLQGLGITQIFTKVHDKLSVYEDFKIMEQITDDEVLYMGDDVPDYEVMEQVSVSACPQNAASEILKISTIIAQAKGGEGAVREIVEKVMRVQEKW